MLFLTVGKKETRYCLANAANPDPKCRVCGYCEDKQFSQPNIIERKYTSERDILDVEKAIFQNKPNSALRIIYKVNDDLVSRYRFKIVQDHAQASAFLTWNKQLNTDFHSCTNYPDYVPTFYAQSDCWGGFGFFDVNFRTDLDDLRSIVADEQYVLECINSMLECQKVVKYYPIRYQSNVLKNTKHLWKFQTIIPQRELNEKFLGYRGKMKVMDKCAGPEPIVTDESYSRDEFSLFMVQTAKYTEGYFTLMVDIIL